MRKRDNKKKALERMLERSAFERQSINQLNECCLLAVGVMAMAVLGLAIVWWEHGRWWQ